MPEQVYIVRHGHISARRSRLVIEYETAKRLSASRTRNHRYASPGCSAYQ
jgi:hypothetical protein